MNDQDRSELERLKQRHAQLERELASLATQVNLLEKRLELRSVETSAKQAKPPESRSIHPAPNVPVISPTRAVPPPLPPILPRPKEPVREPARIAPRIIAPPIAATNPPREPRSFEMRLGTYWLVRIGIVMLLTGLVFFSNYAYQNFIGKLGPTGKVSLLYLASAALLGAGTWWQRKAAKESLKNYAQVLFAGGLAAVYFTTYAAHHIPNLRVITSSLLDGSLLLGWATFTVWVADRKKSEVLALFAVGLAYYTSVITHVGSFTLYSNLLLTAAAVFFLIRNRWATLSFASVIATYSAYGFWRFFNGTDWHWASPAEGLWFGTFFLMSYWVVFTAAVFLSKSDKLASGNRATFLSLNNVEFFVMFVLTMLQVRQGGFWKFSMSYGAVLLSLAEIARRILVAEPIVKNTYLTQGLLLVTVGLIAKFTGLKLALLLGAESIVLLTLGTARKNLVLQTGAYLCGALAVGWGLDSLERNDWRGLCLESTIGALMVFNAWWSHRETNEEKTLLRPVPAFFVLLALVAWLAATWYNMSAANFPLALSLESVALTASIYLLGMGELPLLGQSFLLMGQVVWLYHFADKAVKPAWWNPVLMIGATVGLSHWWQSQKRITAESKLISIWQALYALSAVGVIYFWLNPAVGAPAWIALSSLLAIGVTAYGVFTRAWWLAACGQILLWVSAGQFVLQLWDGKPAWYFPLTPIVVLGFLSFSAIAWFAATPDSRADVRQPLLQLALVYRWIALLMSLWWVVHYIPEREQTWAFALIGLAVFAWAGWRRNTEALLFSGAFTLAGLALLWWPFRNATIIYLPNVLAVLALLCAQRFARQYPERFRLDSRAQDGMMLLGGLTLCLLLTRWVSQNSSGFYLTASWSAFALLLFASGIVLRERLYRWIGLGVLGCALGRVMIFDVWKLETLYRILSFMALGIVLLVLGFIYNKYQEKIREWL